MRTRKVIACPHCVNCADTQDLCLSARSSCGHAVSLRVRMYKCADTQDRCVSALQSLVFGQAVILRVRYLCMRTGKVTACPHNLTAMLTCNDLACPHVPVCGHARSLRVRIAVPCVRTSSNPACPLSLYADKQRSCVSALYCSQSHVHLCSVRPFM